MRLRRSLAALLLLALAGSGCGGSTAQRSGGGASCAYIVSFHGHRYTGTAVQVEPVTRGRAGSAIVPPCQDTGGALPPTKRQRLAVTRLAGVSPAVAVGVADDPDTVLVRDGASLPRAVRALLRAPACRASDVPLRLRGPWMGILAPNGRTEVDLRPPYDVDLRVARASVARYLRAHMTVRVPAALGRPITHPDVRSALWHPGELAVSAGCEGGRLVAHTVRVMPVSS